MKVIKELNGHSGSSVFLVEKSNKLFVYKTFSKKSEDSAQILNDLPFPTPEIIELGKDYLIMEYIPGLRIDQYMADADPKSIKKLLNFIIEYLDFGLNNSQLFDYKKEIDLKFNLLKQYINIDNYRSFIPNDLPKSLIHGDLTLENILFYKDKFYFIDAHPTDLDSIVFDFNKIKIDLDAFWFLRNITINSKYREACSYISKELTIKYPSMINKGIYIFMLARILPYCKRDLEKNLVLQEIKRIETG